ncbi:SDR family NAD(P)-dependent oxidoreductase [Curtobacterium ammoniigenes]|uniref:SDR family NAD(P)-dependent oxidoreductase n=1 Tax=Curtobacterium ammoniigenes TaxID=395387 RepID=UPI00082F464C|nr:SDR family NAD(P)-dependent oxidoreductase [Curtobacterium ammoniigenes]
MTAYIEGRFAGKTAIVTGAGSGIGRATVLRLLAEGATVIGNDVDQHRLDALSAEVESGRLSTIAGDVSETKTVEELLLHATGSIDLLANVAGIMDAFMPPAEVDDALWDRVLSVNLTGPMRLTRAVLPRMIEQGAGSIVNVASEASFRASASGAAYTTSKHALVGYTRSVAFFYGPAGIRANAVAPGPVATNIEAPMRSTFAAARIGPILQQVIPPVASAEQLAAAITWLLSDDAANVNGAVLPSDGGWSTV